MQWCNADFEPACVRQDTYSFQLVVLPGYNVSSVVVAAPKTVNAGELLSLSGSISRANAAVAGVRSAAPYLCPPECALAKRSTSSIAICTRLLCPLCPASTSTRLPQPSF